MNALYLLLLYALDTRGLETRAQERHSPTKYYGFHHFTTEIINNKNVDQPGYSCKYLMHVQYTRTRPGQAPPRF